MSTKRYDIAPIYISEDISGRIYSNISFHFAAEKNKNINHSVLFWPRGFADSVLGKAYLLLLLFFSENFFEFHEKGGPLLQC